MSPHPHNELLSETQTVTSSETTYKVGVALMHCEITQLQALCLPYCNVYSRKEHVVQLGLWS